MDARNPIVMRFVDGRRGQAVDHQIFGGSSISEPVPKVDLHSANSRDPMHKGELRLARLQLPDQLVHV
jgi:hypothetical protein